jgi:isoaspartyl peptidase/L-asparaginase-like protein (Ntn-hydrolase superfamily)
LILKFARTVQLREKRIIELEEAARNATFHKAMEQHIAEESRKEQEQLQQRQMLQV